MAGALTTYATGLLVIVVLTAGWITVQRAWRRTFPGPEPDALAARRCCSDTLGAGQQRAACHACPSAPGEVES
jgi:hypothetical protein